MICHGDKSNAFLSRPWSWSRDELEGIQDLAAGVFVESLTDTPPVEGLPLQSILEDSVDALASVHGIQVGGILFYTDSLSSLKHKCRNGEVRHSDRFATGESSA